MLTYCPVKESIVANALIEKDKKTGSCFRARWSVTLCALSALTRESRTHQAHNIRRLRSTDKRGVVLIPLHQCSGFFGSIGTAIINAGSAGLMARAVTQNLFDDMRRDTDVGHQRCH